MTQVWVNAHGLTIVDPVTDGNAGRNEHSFNHNELASCMGLRGFGLPGC